MDAIFSVHLLLCNNLWTQKCNSSFFLVFLNSVLLLSEVPFLTLVLWQLIIYFEIPFIFVLRSSVDS